MKTQKVIYRVTEERLRELLGLPAEATLMGVKHRPNCIEIKYWGHGPMIREGSPIPTVEWEPDSDDIGLIVGEVV